MSLHIDLFLKFIKGGNTHSKVCSFIGDDSDEVAQMIQVEIDEWEAGGWKLVEQRIVSRTLTNYKSKEV